MSNVGSAAGGYRVENPATGEVVEKFVYATDEQIDQVLEAAHRGFLRWREETIEGRAAVVNEVAALVGERKQEVGGIIAEEMGTRVAEGIEEAEFCEEIITYYGDHGPEFAADEPLKS